MQKEITVKELKSLKNLDSYEVWSEQQKKWVDVSTSEYFYNGPTGFPRPHDPHSPLNSISIYNDWENRMVVYSVPPEGQKYTSLSLRKQMEEKEAFPTGIDIDIEVVKSERDLLRLFIEEIRDSDNILGWNSTRFDNPYIAKRIEKVLGKKYHEMLCFDHAYSPKYKEIESFGAKTPIVMLSGRIASDYMDLFKKYDPVERSSYKLASMADEILPDLPKLQYSGTLASLYKDDFPFFCRYNLRDTEILKGFEEALGYVALANEIYHMSMSQWRDVTGTIGLTQNTIDNYCIHTLEKRVPDRSSNVPGNISGAYVLRPKVGLHPWVGSVDINSLYPSAIRSINVSTETVLGQFEETEEACVAISEETDKEITFVDENGGKETNTGKEWNKILKENNATVSGYGTVFTQDFKGIIPSVLEEWYDLRKEYQKKKKEAYEKAQEILKKYN